MARLYVALYKAIQGNYEHWALFLESNDEELIFEVIGEHPSFVKNVVHSNPSRSLRHRQNIFVSDINQVDVAQLKDVVQKQKVDNETLDWTCQDYVMETLETLIGECIIDEDDADVKKALRKLKNEFGSK